MSYYSLISIMPKTPPVDADAQAFITAAGITDNTQKSAINTLVNDMKGYGIWTKMKAIYPFVGGTSTTHKFNLKNPLDTDAAFRLVFNGGWTHSANGALPNGTNAYANTKLTASISLTISSGHLSIYSRSNISEGKYDFAATNNINTENSIISRWTDNKFYFSYGTPTVYPSFANSDSRGHFLTNRNSVTNTTSFKNGTKVYDAAQTSTSLSNVPLYIAALNNSNNALLFSSKEYAFASIGDGLLDSEANNLYLCVQQFNTTLGRQV